MKILNEVVKQGTDADVTENLLKCAIKLRQIADAIPVAPVDDFVGIVAQCILRYVATETAEASNAMRKDIKLFAWRTRNIFEGYLLLKHTLLSPKNAEEFCAQRVADEASILQSLLGVNPELTGEEIIQIKARVVNLKEILDKHGFSKANYWRVDQLAESVGMKKDYAAFFKLYSKYVHPSSWIIVAEADEYSSSDYWEVLILNAQLYSNACCGEGEVLQKSRLQ